MAPSQRLPKHFQNGLSRGYNPSQLFTRLNQVLLWYPILLSKKTSKSTFSTLSPNLSQWKLCLQPGFYPINAFPESLDENGILSDVKKLLQKINKSFKKYAFPCCPLGALLFLMPYLGYFFISFLNIDYECFFWLPTVYILGYYYLGEKK